MDVAGTPSSSTGIVESVELDQVALRDKHFLVTIRAT